MSNGAKRLGSVDRALQLVLLLRRSPALSVSQVAAALGVAPSTAHRLLVTLVRHGFAVQDSRRRYEAGPQAAPATTAGASLGDLIRSADPVMRELAETVAETVQLLVLEGHVVRFVHGVESARALRVSATFNTTIPAHHSAGGKVLLADLSRAEVQRRFEDLFPAAGTAAIPDLATLHDHLALVRDQGFGTTHGEVAAEISRVGVAVRDGVGRSVAALSVAVPASRYSARGESRWVAALRGAAGVLSDQLRGTGAAQ